MALNRACPDSGAVISLPSLIHSHADKLAKVQGFLRHWWFSLQFSLWGEKKKEKKKRKKRKKKRKKRIKERLRHILGQKSYVGEQRCFEKYVSEKWQFLCVYLLFFCIGHFFFCPIFTWSIAGLHETLFSHSTHSACQDNLISRKRSENHCFKSSIVLKSSWKRVPP